MNRQLNYELIQQAFNEISSYGSETADIFEALDIKDCLVLLERVKVTAQKKVCKNSIQFKVDKYFTEEGKQQIRVERAAKRSKQLEKQTKEIIDKAKQV